MRVRDLLAHKSASLISVEPSTELGAVAELMIVRNIGGVPVVTSAGDVVGFVAERDVVGALVRHHGPLHRLRAEEVMQKPPVCDADDSVEDVMERMTAQRHRHLVVQDRGRAAGVISIGDLVKERLLQLQTETGVLRDYLAGQRASRAL